MPLTCESSLEEIYGALPPEMQQYLEEHLFFDAIKLTDDTAGKKRPSARQSVRRYITEALSFFNTAPCILSSYLVLLAISSVDGLHIWRRSLKNLLFEPPSPVIRKLVQDNDPNDVLIYQSETGFFTGFSFAYCPKAETQRNINTSCMNVSVACLQRLPEGTITVSQYKDAIIKRNARPVVKGPDKPVSLPLFSDAHIVDAQHFTDAKEPPLPEQPRGAAAVTAQGAPCSVYDELLSLQARDEYGAMLQLQTRDMLLRFHPQLLSDGGDCLFTFRPFIAALLTELLSHLRYTLKGVDWMRFCEIENRICRQHEELRGNS